MAGEQQWPAFTVEELDGKGRGCVAASALSEGEVVLEEYPDVAVLYSGFAASRCSHCFNPGNTPPP